MTSIKIGDFNRFKSRTKRISPFEKFFKYIAKEVNLSTSYALDCNKIKVAEKDLQKLKILQLLWYREICKVSNNSSIINLSWDSIYYSPGLVENYDEGYVHLLPEYTRKRYGR